MEIQISDKVVNYLKEKQVEYLVFIVNLHEEPCTQIFTPAASIITSDELEGLEKVGTRNNIDFYIHAEFKEHFGIPETINLALKGLIKKKIEITSIDPKITNICKI